MNKEYSADKKLKKYLAKVGYKRTEKYKSEKGKRIEYIVTVGLLPFVSYGIGLIPCIWAGIVFWQCLAESADILFFVILGVWSIGYLRYRSLCSDCFIVPRGVSEESLIFADEKLIYGFKSRKRLGDCQYEIKYKQIEKVEYSKRRYTLYIHCKKYEFSKFYEKGGNFMGGIEDDTNQKLVTIPCYFQNNEEILENFKQLGMNVTEYEEAVSEQFS
jgi:hypothetical protein